jgi:hypothetical protein
MYLHEKVLDYNTGQTPQYGKIRDPELDEGDFVFALGRDVYEPQVSLPQEPEEVDGFDFGDIENRKKKRQEDERKLTKIKVKWAEWQEKLDAAYDEALKYDKDSYLKASEKAKVWKRLANSFSQDNPYTTEDQLIRSKAVERMEYWRNYREPTPPETIRQEPSYGSAVSTALRSSYKTLSASEVQSMPNVSIRKEEWGFYGHSTIKHYYNLKAIKGDKVVVDNATGLMWHQSGSDEYMGWKKAKEWIEKLNRKGYAGYHDWRLPTVEEAASLLESSVRSGDLYIDPVFSNKQIYIWTGDRYGSKGAWYLDCYAGAVGWTSIWHDTFVRPVRSME